MEHPERRITRRYTVQVPLNFRLHKRSNNPFHFGEMIDVSSSGVSFSTKIALRAGELLDVFLSMPPDIMGRPSPEWQWVGVVIYSRPSEKLGERTTVGVRFSCWQRVDDSRERSVDVKRQTAAKAPSDSG